MFKLAREGKELPNVFSGDFWGGRSMENIYDRLVGAGKQSEINAVLDEFCKNEDGKRGVIKALKVVPTVFGIQFPLEIRGLQKDGTVRTGIGLQLVKIERSVLGEPVATPVRQKVVQKVAAKAVSIDVPIVSSSSLTFGGPSGRVWNLSKPISVKPRPTKFWPTGNGADLHEFMLIPRTMDEIKEFVRGKNILESYIKRWMGPYERGDYLGSGWVLERDGDKFFIAYYDPTNPNSKYYRDVQLAVNRLP